MNTEDENTNEPAGLTPQQLGAILEEKLAGMKNPEARDAMKLAILVQFSPEIALDFAKATHMLMIARMTGNTDKIAEAALALMSMVSAARETFDETLLPLLKSETAEPLPHNIKVPAGTKFH